MRISPLRLVNRITAAYVLLFCFVPPVQVGDNYRLLAIASAVVWLCSALLLDPYFFNGATLKFALISVACIALIFLWRLNIQSMNRAFAYTLQPIIIVLVGLVSFFAFKKDRPFLNFMFALILVLVCFYCVTTIIGVIEDPYASRIANSEWLEDRFEGNENVGLYGYVYMCVFLVPLLLYKIISRISLGKLTDILCICALVLIIAMVALAGYLIAILCICIGSIMILLLRKKNHIRTVIVAALCVLAVIFYKQIMTALVGAVGDLINDNPIYNTKLNGFMDLYNEGELQGSAWGDRINNYAASLRSILHYPVVGCYLFGVQGGGGHSFILDTVGKFGWFTSCLFFLIVWKYPYKVLPNGPRKHVVYSTVLVMSIVYGLLDPYSQEFAITLFFIMPYIVLLDSEKVSPNSQQKGVGTT